MGIRKCQQHTGPQNWGLGLHSKGPSSLDWRACPCHAEGFRSCWSIALSPTSSENILHEQMSLPTTMGTNPGHGSCRHPSRQRVERCCQHQLDQGQRGDQSMALGLQGQEQTTLEPSQLALGVPQASCALLLMRCKSLFLQGRDQGRWKWSCSSVLSSMEMPTVSHGVCPDGAEPCLGTSRVVMSDGEASINAEGPFPSPTLGCLQTLFPSPPQHGRKRLCFGAGKELPRS